MTTKLETYNSPPGLLGTIFSEQEKEQARLENKLLFISLNTDPICNLACPDCYVEKKKSKGKKMSFNEYMNVLDQAKELGAKTLRIAGEGEPLLDKKFWGIIEKSTYSLGLDAFFFTNGTLVDEKMALKISQNQRLTTVVKFSGSPERMEYLTGSKGKFRSNNFVYHDGIKIPKYIKNLIDVGMNKNNQDGNSRLGIEFLLRKSNYGFSFDIFRWARRNNIIPYFEQNLEAGMANLWSSYKDERVSDEDAYSLSERLLEIDQNEFCNTWKPSIPYIVGGICEGEKAGCKKYTYNIVVSSRGDINPCYATKFSLGNIRTSTLQEGMNHPLRQKLLENPKFNCLCRVYSRSGQPRFLSELKDNLDYDILPRH